MPISTVIDGRARYSVNVRYAADFRADPRALEELLVPIPPPQPLSFASATSSGRGTAPAQASQVQSRGEMAGMNDGGSMGATAMGDSANAMPSSTAASDSLSDRWQQSGSVVPLGVLADIRVVTGPPMIKNENGTLVGYLYADIDASQRDLGGWVEDAKRLVASELALPAGMRLEWTGQYEFMAELEARLRTVVPLTLALVIFLLYLSLRGWAQTWLVLMSLPFAIAGSIWLLSLLNYNLSTAVWVGLIAVGGVAAQTGIVVVVYLDQAYQEARAQGRLAKIADIDAAVVEGASKCLRPMLMTVATTVFGLMPLLWESGVGADLSARTAAPVVGGLWSCMFLTLLVLPAVYTIWRRWQFTHGSVRAD
jgi:Cu(I)/Ag(I) efflux system membrane protein CusA/SilA